MGDRMQYGHSGHKPSELARAIATGSSPRNATSRKDVCAKSPIGAHYWDIEEPDGSMSKGVCRYCGKCREFANSLSAAYVIRVVHQ